MEAATKSKQVMKIGLLMAGLALVGVFFLSGAGKPLRSGTVSNGDSPVNSKTFIVGARTDSSSSYESKCVSACRGLLPADPRGDKDCSLFCPPTEPAKGCHDDCLGKCAGNGMDCQAFCGSLCGQIGTGVVSTTEEEETLLETTADDVDGDRLGEDLEEELSAARSQNKAELCQSQLDEILKSDEKLLFKPLTKLAHYFPVSADATVFLEDGKAVKMGNRKSVRGDDRVGMEQKFLSLSHKFANVEGESPSVLMVFGDNTVVTANADPCEIDAVYHPRQDGQMNDAIVARANANVHVMQDKCSEGGRGCGGFDGNCCARSSYWRCGLKCSGRRCTCV